MKYTRSSSAGVFSYSVDGGTAVQVNRQNATADVQELLIYIPGAAANHTLTLGLVSGFDSFTLIEGMDTAAPNYVRVLNAGASTSKSSHWNDTSTAQSAIPMITAEAPDVTFINLGINNWRAAAVTSQYTTDMQAVINAAKAGGGQVILVSPFQLRRPIRATLSSRGTGTRWRPLRPITTARSST